jgi:hypothetical protein
MAKKMIHANPYQPFQTSRATYTADASGVIPAVAAGDILDMLNSGCEIVGAIGPTAATLWSNAGAPSNGTSGTLAGETTPGDLLVDSTNKTLYQNTNTSLSPTWSLKAAASGGTFDGVVGGVTPAAGTFTTLNASGLASLASATLTGYFQGSVANGLTAVGTTRADALQLAKQFNVISTAATTAVGVVLPVGVVGMEIDIDGLTGIVAASFHVYASGSETIDTVAGATGVILTKPKTVRFKMVAANTWVSAVWGAVSS